MTDPEFAGLRVLVAEDEALVAMMLEDMLDELGCEVVGPCASLTSALETGRSAEFDVALIDMHLRGERADSVIAELSARSIPTALASGSGNSEPGCEHCILLSKPYGFDQLRSALSALREQQRATR